MILAEPPKTNYDLHFVLAGIPVRVHPFFWLTALILGIQGHDRKPPEVLLWVATMFASILVHELGHALAIRHFGWQPRISLYHFGGLAAYDPSESYSYTSNPNEDNPRVKIAIAAAGPAAGFLLAGVVVLAMLVTRNGNPILFGGSYGLKFDVSQLSNWRTQTLVVDLLFINIFWGLMNLLPIYPLDGGQIARELLAIRNPNLAVVQSLFLSVICGAGMAVFSLAWFGRFDLQGAIFMAILFGVLAFSSYLMLKQVQGGGYGGFGSRSDDRPW